MLTQAPIHPCAAAILSMLGNLTQYCTAYRKQFDFPVGENYVLGPCVLRVAQSLRELLSGPTGNMDCGRVDSMILALLKSNGFSEEDINN